MASVCVAICLSEDAHPCHWLPGIHMQAIGDGSGQVLPPLDSVRGLGRTRPARLPVSLSIFANSGSVPMQVNWPILYTWTAAMARNA